MGTKRQDGESQIEGIDYRIVIAASHAIEEYRILEAEVTELIRSDKRCAEKTAEELETIKLNVMRRIRELN